MKPRKRAPVKERFASKYSVNEAGCWIWTSTVHKNGYGSFSHLAGMRKAHRVSYEIHVGPIPDGLCVLHRCDVPRCVNPAHLFLGTRADNSADMVAKGRQSRLPRQGLDNGRAKVTPDDVFAIRAASASGQPQRAIARATGLSQSQIGNIVRGVSWAHVAPTPHDLVTRKPHRCVGTVDETTCLSCSGSGWGHTQDSGNRPVCRACRGTGRCDLVTGGVK